MNDQRYVTVSFRSKRSKCSDYSVLTPKAIDVLWFIGCAHHKLDVVDYNVLNIVNVLCMLYSLGKKQKLVFEEKKFPLILDAEKNFEFKI